jgi:hypothetical protein
MLERGEIKGLYGSDPDISQVFELRDYMYSLLDGAVRQWVGDARFIPRFLLSAVVFLIVYFGLTLGIARSIPVVTALVVSLAVGIAGYFLLSRRDIRSEAVLDRRIALRSRVDSIRFEESEFAHLIEARLAVYDGMDSEDLMEILGTDDDDLVDDYPDEAFQLYRYLRKMFSRYEVWDELFLRVSPVRTLGGGALRGVRPAAVPVATERLENLRRKVSAGKIDLPLYALYMQLRAGVISNR